MIRLLSLCTLAAAAAAQTTTNTLEIYSGTTSFTSRGSVGVNAGEVHQGFHGSHWGSIGDSGTTSALLGLMIVTQDQNAATQEGYDLVVRSGNDSTGPTPGVAGELCTVTGLTTPSGSGTLAWIITTNFSSPCTIPEKAFLSAGVRLQASATWPTDGQSVHSTQQTQQQSGPHQEDHAWQILPGNVVSHPTLKRTFRVGLVVDTPLLQNGVFATTTTTYSRGMGGMFPPSGTHGWSTHIRAGSTYASGFAAVFLGTAKSAVGLPIGTIGGSLCLDPTGTLVPFPLVPLDASGNADIAIVDPLGTYGPATVYLQAVVGSPSLTLHFTNLNGTTLQ